MCVCVCVCFNGDQITFFFLIILRINTHTYFLSEIQIPYRLLCFNGFVGTKRDFIKGWVL